MWVVPAIIFERDEKKSIKYNDRENRPPGEWSDNNFPKNVHFFAIHFLYEMCNTLCARSNNMTLIKCFLLFRPPIPVDLSFPLISCPLLFLYLLLHTIYRYICE